MYGRVLSSLGIAENSVRQSFNKWPELVRRNNWKDVDSNCIIIKLRYR